MKEMKNTYRIRIENGAQVHSKHLTHSNDNEWNNFAHEM